MNRYRMFFVQTSTLPSSMHWKLTKLGRCCMQNHQLPTKGHVKLQNGWNTYHKCGRWKKTCVVNLPSQPVRGAVDDRCVRKWRILLELISLDSLNMDMVCISLQHILPFSGVWWNDRNRLWHQVQVVKCVQQTILSLWGAARDKLVALISHEMVKQFMP